MEKSIFMTLNDINVNDKTEMKNGLTYLSWAYCWAEVKKIVPDAQYTIYERDTEFGPVNYFTDGKTCWVKTGVTLDGLEHIEQLPVMDFKNKSIPLNAITSTDVNKAIQRSLTKACARHGLGLYIYAGEDLPECEKDDKPDEPPIPRTGSTEAAQKAGDRKLEELNARIAKAAGKPLVEAQQKAKEEPAQEQKTASTGISGAVATPEQIEYIKDHASDDDYMDIMTRYGANLENLSQADAEREIAEIDKHNEPMIPTCERCGKAITGVALPDGSRMTASELIGKSKLTYNGVYCFGCMKELSRKKKAG